MEQTLPGARKTVLYSTPIEVADLAATVDGGEGGGGVQWDKPKANLQYVRTSIHVSPI